MDKRITDLLDLLGIPNIESEKIDDYQVFHLEDYDLFNQIYNKLERNIEVERDSDSSSLNEEDTHITYIYKDLLIELVGIFDEDDYTLNIYLKED